MINLTAPHIDLDRIPITTALPETGLLIRKSTLQRMIKDIHHDDGIEPGHKAGALAALEALRDSCVAVEIDPNTQFPPHKQL